MRAWLRKVLALLGRSSLDPIRQLLRRVGVDGMTVTSVHEVRARTDRVEIYRGAEIRFFSQPRLRIEIVVEDGRTPALVEELWRATRTGRGDEGLIYVLDVEEAILIDTV